MGSKVSVETGPPKSPIVDMMKKKYGDKTLKYLNVWTAEFGFPIGGSLSLKIYIKIRGKFEGKRKYLQKLCELWKTNEIFDLKRE